MWKVRQVEEGQQLIFALSGRLEGGQLEELQQLISSQAADRPIFLDLTEVKLVDQESVTFLSLCAARGVSLRSCPAYIREWIEAENTQDARAQNTNKY